MARAGSGIGALALFFALTVGAVPEASAQNGGQNPSYNRVSRDTQELDTQELAAQSRPRIIIRPRSAYPGPNAKRYCRSWLAKEYRVSGPVIVPGVHCWWQ